MFALELLYFVPTLIYFCFSYSVYKLSSSVVVVVVVVVVPFQLYLVRKPTKCSHADSKLCIWIGVSKINRDAFASAVDYGDAFVLQALSLPSCSMAAVATISDGSGRRDDSMPWYGGILEEFQRRTHQARVGRVASEARNVAIGCHSTVRNEASDVVDLGCG